MRFPEKAEACVKRLQTIISYDGKHALAKAGKKHGQNHTLPLSLRGRV
jgi:hypothetical protein